MQKGKEHTEMEILSLPTDENQKEFITFQSWPQRSTMFWVKNGQRWGWRMLRRRLEEELVTNLGHKTTTSSRAGAMTPHDASWRLMTFAYTLPFKKGNRLNIEWGVKFTFIKKSIFQLVWCSWWSLSSKQALSPRRVRIMYQINWQSRHKNWTASLKTSWSCKQPFPLYLCVVISKIDTRSTLRV